MLDRAARSWRIRPVHQEPYQESGLWMGANQRERACRSGPRQQAPHRAVMPSATRAMRVTRAFSAQQSPGGTGRPAVTYRPWCPIVPATVIGAVMSKLPLLRLLLLTLGWHG